MYVKKVMKSEINVVHHIENITITLNSDNASDSTMNISPDNPN